MVYHCSPLQFIHTPCSKRDAQRARSVQITKKATQHRREKLEEEGKQQQGQSYR